MSAMDAAGVAAEQDLLDGQEKRVLGGVVVTLGFTNAAVKDLAPEEMEQVAAYLIALLGRAPVKDGKAYAAHRIVLGALATELRGFAAAAGAPVGGEADLRAATSQAADGRINARLADQQAAHDRHMDDVLLAHHAQREISPGDVAPAPAEEEGPDVTATTPAPTVEADDDWLS